MHIGSHLNVELEPIKNPVTGEPESVSVVHGTGFIFKDAEIAFSFVAAVAQWALHGAALLSPMMKSSSPLLAGTLLATAGVFQWTRWKHACLNHCRSPLQFLLHDWREGPGGALAMGIKHGAFCTGCCWMLMALLFIAGVMNMLWVAAITILVLIEKVAPQSWRIRHAVGALLIGWGLWVTVASA